MSEDGARKKALTPEQKKALLAKLLKKKAKTQQKKKIQVAPTSFAQERLWFLMQLDPESTAYNIPTPIRIRGAFDLDVLEQALHSIVQRHESLRTTFSAGNTHAMQNIRVDVDFQLQRRTVTPETNLNRQIKHITAQEASIPFDLVRGPLFRAVVHQFGKNDCLFIFIMHHIISDGTSTQIFIQELAALYQAFATGSPNPLPALNIQYPDYAQWQRDFLQEEALDKQRQYWEKNLQGNTPLSLPTDYPRPTQLGVHGRTLVFELSHTAGAQMHALAQSGVTLYMVALALFQVLLQKYSGQDDICVGTPIAGRNKAEVQPLIGFFINTLVMRVDLSGDPSFLELLTRVKETALGAYAQQDLPFEKLVELLQPERDMSRNPFFQVMFTFQNYQTEPALKFQGLRIEPVMLEHESAKFDLTLTMGENHGKLIGGFEYNTDLFKAGTIEQMIRHFTHLADALLANPQQPIQSVAMLSPDERDMLVEHWSGDRQPYANADTLLHRPFEAQAERNPHAIAVIHGEQSISYAQLNRNAEHLADHLSRQGVSSGDYVAVCVDRSIALVTGLIAILKLGAAYIPVDPQYPQARIDYMLRDANPTLVLTTQEHQAALPEHLPYYRIDDLAQGDTSTVRNNASLDDVAYVIYTSGSSGRPKGVMIPHRAIVNHMHWMCTEFPLRADDRVLQKTPFSFDASVWEFWAPLWQGATLVLAKPNGHQDPEYLVETLLRTRITTLQSVPSLLRMLLQTPGFSECHSLQRLFCGGEQLTQTLVDEVKALLPVDIINLYGPTEATIDSTYYLADAGIDRYAVPIGKPIGNAKVYVLDQNHNPLPIGAPGELYIGGCGVALGYLNQPALSERAFLPSPFNPEARLYRTGDQVRWLSDGCLSFIGRMDDQVKLRGYRIELGEIEAVLGAVTGVTQVAVTVRQDMAGGPRLVAYVQTEETVRQAQLLAAAKAALPAYMLPTDWVNVSTLPLSPSGKIDRKRLPKPEIGCRHEGDYVAPRSYTEQILAAIWSSLLARQPIGADDHFFDIGGHSLLGTQLMSQIRERFQVEMPLKTIFLYPVLADLALQVEHLLAQSQGMDLPPIIACRAETDKAPLSFAQERLWFLAQLEPNQSVYNIPIAIRLRGVLDQAALQQAFNALYTRQHSLRTYFALQDNQPVQKIATDTHLPIEWRELASASAATDAVRAFARTPFRLDQDTLIRVLCLSLTAQDHILAINMHHIISDGWSTGLLIQELTVLYMAAQQGVPAPLNALKIQYADYAAWQREVLQGEHLERQMAYWRRTLHAIPDRLHLITDKPRPPMQTFNGRHYAFELPPALKETIMAVCASEQITLYMLLLAAYQILLSRYAKQQDICVGTPVAGRNRAEMEALIGYFINALVMRARIAPEISGRDFLAQVKETVLGAFAHQDLPFESLIEAIHFERDMRYPPIAQVGFTLQNTPLQHNIQLPELQIEGFDFDAPSAKLDMILMMMEVDGVLTGAFEYNTDLFEEKTIARMTQHYIHLLDALVNGLEQPLAEYTLFNADQLYALLGLNAQDYDGILPLTPVQKDLYLATQLDPDTLENSIGVRADLKIAIDVPLWKQALQTVFDHQPGMRVNMVRSPWPFTDFVYQAMEKNKAVAFTYYDWTDQTEQTCQQQIQDLVYRKYTMTQALIPSCLIKRAEQHYIFISCTHHIAGDGASGVLHLNTVIQTYEALCAHTTHPQPKPVILDYIRAAQSDFDHTASLAYWRKRFETCEALDYPTAAAKITRVHDTTMITHARFKALKKVAREHRATPALLLKMLYAFLIDYYCRPQADFVFTEVTSGRSKQHLRGLGCYFQQIPVIIPQQLFALDQTLQTCIARIKQDRKAAAPYQNLSIAKQVSMQPQGRIQFLFNYYLFPGALDFRGSPVELTWFAPPAPEHQVQLVLEQTREQITARFTYHTGRFDGQRFLARLQRLVDQLLAGTNIFPQPDVLFDDERQFIQTVNATAQQAAFPFTNIPAGFDQRAQQSGERIAVVRGDEHITYDMLYQRSNQLAHLIHALHLPMQAPIAICMSRGVRFMVALLGALKSGCSYIPIDPNYPQQRIRHILQDSGSELLITDRSIDALPDFNKTTFQYRDNLLLDDQDAGPLHIDIAPTQLAYQIYTSGSTGAPKSVGIEHRGMLNLLNWYITEFNMQAQDATIVISALGFDLTQKNLFALLWLGGKIVFPSQDDYQPEDILQTIETQRVTLLNCAPSAFYPLIAQEENDARLETLRVVLLGGEPIQKNQVARWYAATQTVLVNTYGPTECTDIAAFHRVRKHDIESEQALPIGRPNDNMRLYVLTRPDCLCVPGAPGELWIAGSGVGRGYLNDAEHTQRTFVRSPIDAHSALYRTGDLVRQNADGTITFLGRVDHQIKLRGLRIELGEIEAVIRAQEHVNEVVATVHNEQLIAYYTGTAADSDLQQALQRVLPSYMLPHRWMPMEAFCYTPNGKIDRKTLPEPSASATPYVEASNDMERLLVDYWRQLLQVKQVGINDNFFALGGHSLLATQCISWLRERFNVDLPLRELFDNPNIARLAQLIKIEQDKPRALTAPPIIPVPRTAESPLSYAQERLWFLDQLEPDNAVYNIPAAVRVSGAFQPALFYAALCDVVDRHEVLRTTFTTNNGQATQHIHVQLPPTWENLTLQDLSAAAQERELQRLAHSQATTPFSLSQGPLLRGCCAQIGEQHYALYLTMHHIIADGWSSGILLNEVATLYLNHVHDQAIPLPPMPIQYADYAHWQRHWLTGDVLQQHLAYWRDKLHGAPSVLRLPTDKPRPPMQTFNGAVAPVQLSEQNRDAIQSTCQRTGCTPFMLLLAAYQIVLSRYTRQMDICVGSPIAGRNYREVEGLIGLFVNGLVLRTQLTDNPTGETVLARVKETVLGAFAHQDLPVEMLVDALQPERNLSYPPLAQVGFALQNTPTQSLTLDELSFQPIEAESVTAKYDMTLILSEVDGRYVGLVEYNVDLFYAQTITTFIRHYSTILSQLCATVARPISEYSLLNKAQLFDALALEPQDYDRILRLTPMQRDLALAGELHPDTLRNSMGIATHLRTHIDVARWRTAVDNVCREQIVTRAHLIKSHKAYLDDIYQALLAQPQTPVLYTDHSAENWSEQDIHRHIASWVYRPYALFKQPLIEHALLKIRPDYYIKIMRLNHIVLDGVGGTYLAKQIVDAYGALCADTAFSAPDVVYDQYVDFALAHFDRAEHTAYWREALSTVEPLDFPLADEQANAHSIDQYTLSAAQWQTLRSACRKLRLTPALLFKAAYGLLLQTYCRSTEDFVVFEVTSGRSKGYLRAPGLFYQQIPFIFPIADMQPQTAVSDYLDRVKNRLRALGERQYLSLTTQTQLTPGGRLRFYYNYYHFGMAFELHGAMQATEQFPPQAPDDQVQLILKQHAQTLQITLEHHPQQFCGGGFTQRLWQVAQQLLQVPTLSELTWVTEQEQALLIDTWNQTERDLPAATSVVDLIVQQAEKTPQRIAIAQGAHTVTYQHLLQRADAIAQHLLQQGLNTQEAVGVLTQRNAHFIVAILGVLRAGGCYIPLDPDYPQARLQMISDDAGLRFLLTESAVTHIPVFRGARIDIDTLDPAAPIEQSSLPRLQRDALFYQIYTSGSTGRPKGVAISQQNALNLIQWVIHQFALQENDAAIVISALGFDLTQKNIFAPLCVGAKVIFASCPHYDVLDIVQTIDQQQATWLNCAPSALYPLLQEPQHWPHLASLRHVLLGGEAIQIAMIADWLAQADAQLVNMYGPTECTDIAAYHVVDPDTIEAGLNIPIGRPNDNVRLYVLTTDGKPAPIGVVGELHIGGMGVGAGYVDDAEKTRACFVADPFTQDAAARMYKTGDLVRYRRDGQLVFIGRCDNQVKVRGLRIELGEIASVLNELLEVEQIVMHVSDEQILAYYQGSATIEALQRQAQKLPQYMQPNHFIAVTTFPLTANGKIDFAALPQPQATQHVYVAPRNAIEQALCAYWRDLLAVEQVGVLDGFFQIGGHSLLATQVIAWIREHYQVELPLRVLFEQPTIAALAEQVEVKLRQGEKSDAPAILPVSREQPIPLSFAQERLWLMDRLAGQSVAYHMPAAMRIHGPIEITALQTAYRELVLRHEVLRSYFLEQQGQTRQQWLDIEAITLTVEDLSTMEKQQRDGKIYQLFFQLASHPFVLSSGPLIRFKAIICAEQETVLMFCLHHIISDGWSMRIFIQELVMLYQAAVLQVALPMPELSVQYADYAVWQRDWLSGERLQAHLTYWLEHLHAVPVLLLPTDHKRPLQASQKGDSLHFTIPKPIRDQVTQFSQAQGVTPFMTLLACYAIFLTKYSGQNSVCIGTPVAGRTFTALESLIGFFINTLPLKVNVDATMSLQTIVEQVREVVLQAFAHQDIPFEKVVEHLPTSRDTQHSPIFQTLFALQTSAQSTAMQSQEITLDDLRIESIEFDVPVAKFELSVTLSEAGDGFYTTFEYRTDLFTRDTMTRMGRHFQTLLAHLTAQPEHAVQHIGMLSAQETTYWRQLGVDAPMPVPQWPCLHQYVEAAASHHDTAVAVRFEQTTLTYQQLEQQANQLAHALMARQIGAGCFVAIATSRNLQMMVAMLAVLKTGAAYVPIDPDYPPDRIAYMLTDCGATLVLGTAAFATPVDITWLDVRTVLVANVDAIPVNVTVTAQAAAYMIYTSGSTGKPKGVVICHSSIVNHMLWMQKTFPLAVGDRVLQKTPYSFDASVWECWAPLMHGGQLVLAKPQGHKDPNYLCQQLQTQQIQMLQVVPALLSALLQQTDFSACTSLKYLFCGGEVLPQHVACDVRLALPDCTLINLYGPTEATIDTTYCIADLAHDRDSVPIGRPIDGACVYVLDEQRNPTPQGVAGELYIGGAGLALGYHQLPTLTEHAFIPHPFSADAQARLYRTGDLVRWLADGRLEYIARQDQQIKLRGYRIELGEIESLIAQQPGVTQAIVSVREDRPGDQRLVAYLLGDAETDTVRTAVAQFAPDYMQPSHWVRLQALPLTPCGKIDRALLPKPEIASTVAYVAPQSDTEQLLATLWAEQLGLEKISVLDDFFVLGGHSMLAVKVAGLMEQALGRPTPIALLFQYPTIQQFCAWLTAPYYQSPLLMLQDAPGRPKLFCIHPVGGQAIVFRHIAEYLARQWSVVGLESVGLATNATPHITIEAMAQAYLHAISSLQSEGPYYFLGYSMGGLIAYEMAQQLAQGGQPAHLLLLDCETPTFSQQHVEHKSSFLNEMVQTFEIQSGIKIPIEATQAILTGFDVTQTEQHLQPEEIQDLTIQLLEALGLEPDDAQWRVMQRMLAVLIANTQAIRRYALKPSQHRLALLLAQARGEETNAELLAAWRALVQDVAVQTIAGDHAQMIEPQSAAQVAGWVLHEAGRER